MEAKYVCPPCGSHCDDLTFDKRGVCPHCNMILIKEDQSKTIAFYLQDGVEVLDFAGPMEVFVYAGYEVFTVSKTKDPIMSQGILKIVPDYSIEDAPEADILAFFGGNSSPTVKDKKVIKWIRDQKDVEYHFSVCTGAFMLAEAGILDGKSATTFHDALNGLEDNYSKVTVERNARFVDNGKVITTAGVSAGIDGALHMVAKLQGINAAKRTAYYMEYDNWALGNGLLLNVESPYTPTISMEELKKYEGLYAFENDQKIEVVIQENDLLAKVGSNLLPIYHEFDEVFSDVRNHPIYFKKDENGEVVGYSMSENGELFNKID